MSLRASRYAAGDRARWDAFVATAKNATFLFARDYMEYHADRFDDCSWIVQDASGGLVALLPGDRRGDVVRSHGGLTYGGVVSDASMTVVRMGAVFDALRRALLDAGVGTLVYKTVPRPYHLLPADEDLYWLFRHGAELSRRDVLTAYAADGRAAVQERRRRSLRRAAAAGLVARASDDWEAFWEVLADNLQARYGVAPVHSVAEIRALAARFPAQIRLAATYDGERLLAGAVAYLSPRVCHVQYNAATPEGKDRGALDLALAHLAATHGAALPWFDFGASTECDGHRLNAGLAEYKEGFGARTIVHDAYTWDLTTHPIAPR